ncbi:hypothetical protein [Candidatus Merdisoma sp. JLR.KK006]|uniref:hypothetical protein n=1 Tax=Candidatus Merdisoma sp. JLR.KK006 TaxID=3112626 RepID=UPI002FF3C030
MKKVKIVLGSIFVIMAGIFIIGRFMPEPSEEMLVYESKGAMETVIDLAIQGPDNILYLGKIKLVTDNPTVGDIIQAVNSSDEGINIKLGENGEIVQIGDYLSGQPEHWNVLIDNKEAGETNVWNIPVKEYQGITFLFEQE